MHCILQQTMEKLTSSISSMKSASIFSHLCIFLSLFDEVKESLYVMKSITTCLELCFQTISSIKFTSNSLIYLINNKKLL